MGARKKRARTKARNKTRKRDKKELIIEGKTKRKNREERRGGREEAE